MYFSKKTAEPIPEQQTSIWTCSTDQCSGWMREDFSFHTSPSCPFCHAEMVRDTRMLPPLFNHTVKR